VRGDLEQGERSSVAYREAVGSSCWGEWAGSEGDLERGVAWLLELIWIIYGDKADECLGSSVRRLAHWRAV
jgi:hypothetical protein